MAFLNSVQILIGTSPLTEGDSKCAASTGF
jgi:hypothetical protein